MYLLSCFLRFSTSLASCELVSSVPSNWKSFFGYLHKYYAIVRENLKPLIGLKPKTSVILVQPSSKYNTLHPRKWGWPDLPHPNSNFSNSHSSSPSIQGILLLQTNSLALLLHLRLPHFLWSSSLSRSSLPLALQ